MPSQDSGYVATTLGRNIKAARESIKDLTQRKLAERLDCDPMMVSKWERGWHRPSDENLIALSRELKRDLAWFYTEHEEQTA